MNFKRGDRVRVTIPLWKRIRGMVYMWEWLPTYGTYWYDREDYAAYVIIDDNGKFWYIAYSHLEKI